jgi:hypothetical protein
MDIEDAFCEACKNGHLPVAQWLISAEIEASHGKINIHAYNECTFCRVCYNGQLLVAQWLISLGTDATLTSLGTNDVEASHGKINIHADNECAFRYACMSGHLLVAQWLTSPEIEASHGKIDIHIYNGFAFRWACEYGHVSVAQWLQSLLPELYVLVIKNNQIMYYNVIKRLKKIVKADESVIYTECSICQELQSDCSTACKHQFCYTCINEWFQKNSSCPYCRSQMDECFIRN